MRKSSVFFVLVGFCGTLWGQSLGTMTRSAAGPFTWDVANTPFTTATGAKWTNGYSAAFSYYGGGSGYPVLVSSSPNGRIEMYGLSFGSTGNWMFYGDEFAIGAGGIQSASTSSDTMSISNRLVLAASQTWKRVDNRRDLRVFGDLASAPDTVTDLTLDAQNEGGYFVLQGSNSYSGALTLQGLVGLELDYQRARTSKIDATRPVTVNNGARFYLRNGSGYTQEISQLTLNGRFGLHLITENTASPVRLKIASLVRTAPWITLGPDMDGQLILPNEPAGVLSPYICGTTGFATVGADGTVTSTFGTTLDDPAQWTTPNAFVNVNAATVTAPAGMFMTNGMMRFGQTTRLDLNGGTLTLTQGGLLRCNQNTVITNGTIRSSAPDGMLFVQTPKPWNGAPDFTIAANIEDTPEQPVRLVKAGAGNYSLYLSGKNTYSGGTAINEGRIVVTGGGTLGGGDLWIAPNDIALGGSVHRLQFRNSVASTNRVRSIFAPAAGIFKGDASCETTLIVEDTATNLLVEANLGVFSYTLNGPSYVKTAQAANTSVLKFTANHPRVSANLFYLNNSTAEIQFHSGITTPIECNAQLYSDTTSGIFRFCSGTWRMRNVWYSSKTWKGTNIIEGIASLILRENADNCNGDIFLRENGNFTVAQYSLSFVTANAMTGRNYSMTISDNASLVISNGAVKVGGFTGAGATVQQTGGSVSILSASGDLTLKSVASSPVSTYLLAGGSLAIQNQLKGSDGTIPSRFVWTGGELAPWAIYTSMLESNTLVNAGGILSPGGRGMAGYTTINGNYEVTSDAAVLAIDIGNTTSASTWRQSATNAFDNVRFSAGASVKLGGRLEVSLCNGFKPLAMQTFQIIAFNASTTNSLSGSFTNVQDNKVVTTDGQYRFDVTIDTSACTVTLSNAQPNAWSGAAGDYAWSNTNNWFGGVVPSFSTAIAAFTEPAQTERCTLGQAMTIQGLLFDSRSRRYTLTDTFPLTLNTITVAAGQHTLDLPLVFTNQALISVDNVCSNAGLAFGRLAGSGSISNNPRTSVERLLTWAYTPVSAEKLALTPWLSENAQLIYSGYLWNNATTNETWSFAICYDDSAKLKINGVEVYSVGWNTFATSNVVLNPGPNSIELRLGNWSSNVGPLSGFGPVFDPLGRRSVTATSYTQFADAGDGLLLTTDSTRIPLAGSLTLTHTLAAEELVKAGSGTLILSNATVQTVTLLAGRIAFSDLFCIEAGLTRDAGTLDFTTYTSQIKIKKSASVTQQTLTDAIRAG